MRVFSEARKRKGRTSRKQTSRDHLADVVATRQHRIIPEAQHLEALAAQESIARGIRTRQQVLATVDFDDQRPGEADEIDDVGPDGDLTPEFEAEQAPISQPIPKRALGGGHLTTQALGESGLGGVAHRHSRQEDGHGDWCRPGGAIGVDGALASEIAAREAPSPLPLSRRRERGCRCRRGLGQRQLPDLGVLRRFAGERQTWRA
ncbi:hypothetical protein GGR67_002585 [Xanthomonas arboricola]|nr:hypothetical protein [Xanthomonas euroxanthea]